MAAVLSNNGIGVPPASKIARQKGHLHGKMGRMCGSLGTAANLRRPMSEVRFAQPELSPLAKVLPGPRE